jgi:hypothetical protein
MKRYSLSLAIILIFVAVSVMAQTGSGPYDFPIKPGTAAWKALKTHAEKQEVCQIPAAVLEKMTTKDLVQTCLNYPLYGDFMAYDNLQYGFEQMSARFNGLQELLHRKDIGVEILASYKNLDPGAVDSSWTSVERGAYAAQFYFMEMLLSQNMILGNLQRDGRLLLLAECIQKFQSKQKYPGLYSILSYQTLAAVMGRILQMENYTPFIQRVSENDALKIMLDHCAVSNTELVFDILSHAEQYVNANK